MVDYLLLGYILFIFALPYARKKALVGTNFSAASKVATKKST